VDLCVNVIGTDIGNRLDDNAGVKTDQPYPNRLDDWMKRTGANGADLGRRIDKTKQHISMLRKGQRELTVDWAAKIAPLLGVEWHELMILPSEPPPMTDVKLAARFAAAIVALYGDDLAKAAKDTGISTRELQAISSGTKSLSYANMIRFCDATGCPADWLLLGRVTAALPQWAMIRLLTLFPDLVEDQAPVDAVSV